MCVCVQVLFGLGLVVAQLATQPTDLRNILEQAKSRYLAKDLSDKKWRELRKFLRTEIGKHKKEALDSQEAARLLARLQALLGVANLELGSKKDAQEGFEDALKRDPTLFVCQNNVGVLEFDRGLYLRAADRFKKAADCLLGERALVKLKPFSDKTARRADGRTGFETIVDNLAEALHAYELDRKEQRPERAAPPKLVEARQLLHRLENALEHAKRGMVREGTTWFTGKEYSERRSVQQAKESEVRSAKRRAESLRQRRDDAVIRARDYERRSRESRRPQHYRHLQKREEEGALQLAEQLRTKSKQIDELKAELEALIAFPFSGTCELLNFKDDPSF